jgi:hypothetical protein
MSNEQTELLRRISCELEKVNVHLEMLELDNEQERHNKEGRTLALLLWSVIGLGGALWYYSGWPNWAPWVVGASAVGVYLLWWWFSAMTSTSNYRMRLNMKMAKLEKLEGRAWADD